MSEARLDRLSSSDAVLVRDLDRPDLLAADADRDATAARLGGALAVGRLTSTEYAERLDATYAARTMGQPRRPQARPGSKSSTWVSRMLLPEGSRNDVSMP